MHTISKKIVEKEVRGMRIAVMRIATRDILTIEGSVYGGPLLLPLEQSAVATLTADLLDSGTTKHSKKVFRELLAEKGISISFSASGYRLFFSVSCLPEDMQYALRLVVECLTSARFDASELSLSKQRMVGALNEAKTDTRTQASIALSQLLFDRNHPLYSESIAEAERALKRVSRADILLFRKLFGREGLTLAIVGDVDPATTVASAIKEFGKLPAGIGVIPKRTYKLKNSTPTRKEVAIKDKANIDCYFGRTLPLTEKDEDYYPLLVLTSMLGGRGLSTGHLMRTIRDRDGLTYGIYGRLSGFDDDIQGYVRIWATFAPAVYERAVGKVREEMTYFLQHAVAAEALKAKKKEIEGSYQVSLGTSGGLASTIHTILRKGKKLSFIEEYITRIDAISIADLRRVAHYLSPEEFFLSASGTFHQG